MVYIKKLWNEQQSEVELLLGEQMNSEVHFEILKDEEVERRARNERLEAKDAVTANDASDAVSFDRHPFWQIMKKDLGEVRERIINKIMADETMSKYQIDRYKVEAKNIKLFLEHPKMYVEKLKKLLALKRTRKKGN